MKPVRVLHIVQSLNRGGMESRIMDLYRHLDHKNYQYDFYVESGNLGVFDEEVMSLGGKVFYSNKKAKYNIPCFKKFYEFLKKHPEYKIVYAYNQWSGFYLSVAKRCGIPCRIANARTSLQTKSLKNSIKNVLKSNVNRYATHKFAVSKKAGIWLFGPKMVDSGLVKVWPNAIDTEAFKFSNDIRSEVRDELGLDNSFTIIHVGNIRYEKNHPFLLRVFKEIKKNEPDATLVLVGNGSIEELTSMIDKLELRDSIQYLGARNDVSRLLQAADVFVFPSYYEGFPGAVLEAEASGLQCFISDSITEEVLLTDHILSLPLSKGPQYWAKSISEFEYHNREHSWKVIKNAGYDICSLAEKTEQFYKSLNV